MKYTKREIKILLLVKNKDCDGIACVGCPLHKKCIKLGKRNTETMEEWRISVRKIRSVRAKRILTNILFSNKKK